MDLSGLSPEEREEYLGLVSDALNGDRTVTAPKVARLDEMLHDAEQAHRPWASIVMRIARREGLRNHMKETAKAESVSVVDYNGRAVGKALRIGRRRRDAAGREHWQQALIHDFSWDELTAWLRQMESQISALLINKHIANRLLDLRAQYPDTFGPREACEELGLSIEEYLAAA